MNNMLEALRKYDALRDSDLGNDVVGQATLESISPIFADGSDVFERLTPQMVQALGRQQFNQLYQHQVEAILGALNGDNVVLQAPTASGKTLSFQVPILDALIRDTTSHALMLYPTKALALDQRQQLENLIKHISSPRIESWWYDGDVEQDYRNALRRSPPNILITNPDMLHNSFLGHSDLWQKFLRKLKWVVVDEMHEYRGYFGSNVAMILRRFSHHLAQQNIFPNFFLCSATCANAKEHAENLTGLSFREVNSNNSIRPRRQFYFIQPDIPDHQYWDILQIRTVKAGLACLVNGKSVLAFCPTRKFAENCILTANRELDKLHETCNTDIDSSQIRVFRAGLSVDERHAIQEGLKNGSVRLVFTTNALELGIDIGGLDGVILAGFPDSMMSAWQRIGRAGRNWTSEAFVIYYARNNPLDRFYASNLEMFLKKPLDDLVVNPANEDLIEKQLPSLLFETPSLEGGDSILGEGLYRAAFEKLESGAKPVQTGRWRPHSTLDIRGGGSGNFTIKEGSKSIGTLSGHQQFREAYQDAIYMHGGKKYRVTGITFATSGGEITLGSVDPFLKTNPVMVTTVTEQIIYDGKRWESEDSEVEVYYGKVLISEVIRSINEIEERSGEVQRSWTPHHNSANFNDAHAYWIRVKKNSREIIDGVSALQHLLRVGATFKIPLDAHDIFPHTVPNDRKAYIVESYPGGIGIARKALDSWREILEVGVNVAEACNCRKGCPNCIVPPRSRDELDKRAGILLSHSLLENTSNPPSFLYSDSLWVRNNI